MWLNYNYMVALGFQKRQVWKNYPNIAEMLIKSSLDIALKYYEKYGVIFEFYDALDETPPTKLLRKGKPTGGVRDYHWSAAMLFKMMLTSWTDT